MLITEMIRTCPKCGDYYADALLAFCLADGTPLGNVAPTSEKWNEAARAIQAKERILSKQKRKLKWRRIVMSTMAITTLVMLLVAVNALISVETVPNRDIASRPSIPETTPAVVNDSSPASVAAEVSPAPSQNPVLVSIEKETPTPTPIVISASGKPPECSIGNKNQEEKAITDKYGAAWQGSVVGDGPQIDHQELPFGVANTNGAIRIEKPKLITEYQSTFPKLCVATVTASYSWLVTINFNGQRKVLHKNAGRRKFTCEKTGQAWHCP
jgi:hypothetical protein